VIVAVLALAVLFQLAAAAVAFRLMAITGRRWTWGLVAAAILLMVARRCVPLARLAAGDAAPDLWYELIGLAISVLMFAGIAGIAPMFDLERQSGERIKHLNAVLRAIRNVSQLISREKDRDRLLEGVCASLVQTRGYRHAWIALLDEGQGLIAAVEAGFGESFAGLREQLRHKEQATCVRRVLSEAGVVVFRQGMTSCRDCPFCEKLSDGQAMTVRLTYDDETYGVMAAMLPPGVAADQEEQELFLDTAGDVAFALRSLRLEEDRRRVHDELEARVRERTAELNVANEGLQQERYLLRALMDNLPHNIYFKDVQSRFLRINKALAAIFGLRDPSEAVGKTDLDFFTGEHGAQAMADEQGIVCTGQPLLDKEEKETWPDGHTTWVTTTKMPLYDDAGRIVGTFGISRDITEKKQADEAIRAAKEAAEAASRAKSTFLANMSHEIRTPLNAIIGMTELVLQSQLTPQQREFLGTVRDSGEALLSVINDILDFSKIEAGKLVLEESDFDLWESLGDTMKSFALRAHQQGLELACYLHGDVPQWVSGDYGRLRQIVVNLVGNALKFTDRGEVVLEVARESQSEQDVLLHLTVSDTGIGIPPDKQAAIFGMFEQVDTSMTRRHGGTGLGLAIASRLVELMGGRLWLESEVGRGSRFHFTVRLGRAEPPAQRPVPATRESLRGVRVLIVDDNATNRRILEESLRGWQMAPTSASGAGEALEALRQAQVDGNPYRLVLTDAHMPEVDGFMLVQRIRQEDGTGSTVVMMLTSGDRADDAGRCQELGIAAFLRKPIKQSELLEAIEVALGIAEPKQAPPPTPVRRGHRTGLRVLLAEDSLVNQRLAVALLEKEGHMVSVTSNGREALAALQSSPFDLVLMDVQMPEMDGLEATRVIRARERGTGRHLPILAMTAHALKGDRERCLEAGMDGYIAKPIRAEELFDAIDRLFTAQEPASVR